MILALGLSVACAQETLTQPKTLETRCKTESGACYELGAFYFKTSTHKTEGLAFLAKGCRLELKRECSAKEAATRADAFLEAQKEMRKATDAVVEKETRPDPQVEKDKAACLKGEGKACGKVGLYYQYFAPVVNPAKAYEWDQKGCALRDEASCAGVKLHEAGIVKVYKVD